MITNILLKQFGKTGKKLKFSRPFTLWQNKWTPLLWNPGLFKLMECSALSTKKMYANKAQLKINRITFQISIFWIVIKYYKTIDINSSITACGTNMSFNFTFSVKIQFFSKNQANLWSNVLKTICLCFYCNKIS